MRISQCTRRSIQDFSNHYHQPISLTWWYLPRIGVVGGVSPATLSNLAIASLTRPCVTDPLLHLSPLGPVIMGVFGRLMDRSGSKDRPEGMNRFGSAVVYVATLDLNGTFKEGDWNAGFGESISNSKLGDQISLVRCRVTLGVIASTEYGESTEHSLGDLYGVSSRFEQNDSPELVGDVNGISPARQAWRTSSNSFSNVSGSTGVGWGVGEVDS
jgi:hypothetical protein